MGLGELVRKDGFKLEGRGGGGIVKRGFRKLFKARMNLFHKPIDSAIQLAKIASKTVILEKTIGCFFETIGCFFETIGCLYQQTTNKLKLKS